MLKLPQYVVEITTSSHELSLRLGLRSKAASTVFGPPLSVKGNKTTQTSVIALGGVPELFLFQLLATEGDVNVTLESFSISDVHSDEVLFRFSRHPFDFSSPLNCQPGSLCLQPSFELPIGQFATIVVLNTPGLNVSGELVVAGVTISGSTVSAKVEIGDSRSWVVAFEASGPLLRLGLQVNISSSQDPVAGLELNDVSVYQQDTQLIQTFSPLFLATDCHDLVFKNGRPCTTGFDLYFEDEDSTRETHTRLSVSLDVSGLGDEVTAETALLLMFADEAVFETDSEEHIYGTR